MAGLVLLVTNLAVAIGCVLSDHLVTGATIAVSATLALLIVLEAVTPARADWSYGFRTAPTIALARLRVDLFFLVVINRIAGPGLSLVPPLLAMGAASIHERLHIAIWPTGWPLLVRVLLLAVLGQLVQYWWHRALHRVPILWRLHRVHHQPEQMSVLKSARNHPMEDVLNLVVRTLPFVVIGAGVHELTLIGWAEAVIGLLGHANLRVDLGPLARVLTTPAQHALHHSRDIARSSSNFGDFVSVWDRVFGTFRPVRDVEIAEIDVGVSLQTEVQI